MPDAVTTEEAFMRAADDAGVWGAELVMEARARIRRKEDPAAVYADILKRATAPRPARPPRERQIKPQH